MLKKFIETRVSLVMILSCVAGLILPGMPQLPNESAIVALTLLTFFSCYKLKDGGFAAIRWRDIGRFYALRFLLLPIALWWLANLFIPDYATAVFLLSVLPAAVASPAFTNIFGGAVPPAFAIVIISQILSPLIIPLHFALIKNAAAPAPAHLFSTLAICVLLPMAAYALLRRHKKSAAYFYAQNKFFSMLLVAFVIALAIAKQRDVILADPMAIGAPLLVTTCCFAIYIIFGWFSLRRAPRAERITFATCSSFNNAALGVSLALLHFPPPVILAIAVSEIAWSLLPAMMRVFLRLFPR